MHLSRGFVASWIVCLCLGVAWGCGGNDTADTQVTPENEPVEAEDIELVEPDDILRLAGRGQEPGWALRVEGTSFTLNSQFGEVVTEAEQVEIEGDEDSSSRLITAYRSGAPIYIIRQDMTPCVDGATGAPRPYALEVRHGERVLTGCGGDTAEFLSGGTWIVEDINRGGIIDSTHLTVEFGLDGKIAGDTNCNRFSGQYSVSGPEIVIGPLVSTRRACTAEALSLQEQRFLSAMEGPLTVTLTETGALFLSKSAQESLTLRRD